MKREILPASEEHRRAFGAAFRLREEVRNDPQAILAFEYASAFRLYPDEINALGPLIERTPA